MQSFWVTLAYLVISVLLVYNTSAQVTTTAYECDDEYTTNPAVDDDTADEDKVYCNYKQKSQLTAFLLAFFLGFYGGGQWYLGLYGLAGAKLAVTLVFYYASCCLQMAMESIGTEAWPGQVCLCCGWLGIFIWWLVDIIHFGMNDYEDENGVLPYEW